MSENDVFKVLIIDDDVSLGTLLSNTLRNEGLDVCTANNGSNGVDKARTDCPDAILMDINMPQMNGFEACELIKKDPAISSIPVIFMMSMGNDNDRIKGFSCGADDYVIKPVNYKELLARLKRYINKKKTIAMSKSIAASAQKCNDLLEDLSKMELTQDATAIVKDVGSEIKNILNGLAESND